MLSQIQEEDARWICTPRSGSVFFLHIQEEDALWKSFKDAGLYSFRIFKFMEAPKPRERYQFFSAPSRGAFPLEIERTHPSTLGHIVSDY